MYLSGILARYLATLPYAASLKVMRTSAHAALAIASALMVAAPWHSRACAPAPPPGESVAITDEEAVIVWDAATRTEHFIRRARFSTSARDFGFLVPTPTQPALAETTEALFQRLASATRPKVEVRQTPSAIPFSCLATSFLLIRSAPPAATVPSVRVLDFQHVAGYDAVVLEADSADALGNWLKAHGYQFRPSLVEWLKPYVTARWKLTAFKIAQQPNASPSLVDTATVRMTFRTDRPIFPYREPMDQRTGPTQGRRLRLFFISHTRMEGRLGDGTAWPGTVAYANRSADMSWLLARVLPEGVLPATDWLMEFVDNSSPRPANDDLVFFPAAAATPYLPPPEIQLVTKPGPIPIELLLLGTLTYWCWRRRQRRRRAAGAESTS